MRLPSTASEAMDEPPINGVTNGGPPPPYAAAAVSRDSLADYYDASGTLAHGAVTPAIFRQRRRHASSGAAVENGRASTIEKGLPSKGPMARVRHSSYCDGSAPAVAGVGGSSLGLQSEYSTPCHSAHFAVPPLGGDRLSSAADVSVTELKNGSVSLVNVSDSKDQNRGMPFQGKPLDCGIATSELAHLTNGTYSSKVSPVKVNGLQCGDRIIHANSLRTGLNDQVDELDTIRSDKKQKTKSLYVDPPTISASRASQSLVSSDKSSEDSKHVVNHPSSASNVIIDIPSSATAGTKDFLPNYVRCAEIENDPRFVAKRNTCAEFTLEKCSDKSRTKDCITEHKANGVPSVQNTSRQTRAVPTRRGNKSNASSCSSLKFAWKKNYVPFGVLDRLTLGDAPATDGCHEDPLLQSPQEVLTPVDAKFNMYSFPQTGGVGPWRWRDEFALRNLHLTHPSPHLLVSSQWQQHHRMSCLYLGYCLFWALYFCMWAVWSLVVSNKTFYFIYLTNWSIWLLAADTVLQAVNVVNHMRRMADHGEARYPAMPKAFRVSWVLSNITFTTHCFITIAYWATVYPAATDQTITVVGVNTHIIAGLYVMLNLLLSATPRRLLHALHPVMYYLCYCVFNIVYFLAGGLNFAGSRALYPFMDWTSPGRSLLVVGGVVLLVLPALHLLHCCLYAVRVTLWRRHRLDRHVPEEEGLEKGSKFGEQVV